MNRLTKTKKEEQNMLQHLKGSGAFGEKKGSKSSAQLDR